MFVKQICCLFVVRYWINFYIEFIRNTDLNKSLSIICFLKDVLGGMSFVHCITWVTNNYRVCVFTSTIRDGYPCHFIEQLLNSIHGHNFPSYLNSNCTEPCQDLLFFLFLRSTMVFNKDYVRLRIRATWLNLIKIHS